MAPEAGRPRRTCHGDLLNAYLRLTGRVDMRAVERTIHHLLKNGFNPRSNDDGYSWPDLRRVPGTGDPDHPQPNVGRLAAARG